MGRRFRFECRSCGYWVEVSGGNDRGFFATTRTVSCESCLQLYDVDTTDKLPSTRPSLAMQPDRDSSDLHCPKSAGHHVKPWQHPGPCPMCGAELLRGKMTVLWD